MEKRYITYEQEDQVGILTIHRPEALNALNNQIVKEITWQLDEIAKSDVRCVIISGSGEKSFVAGADISEMKNLSPEEAALFSKAGNEMMNKIESLPIPVIAAVNGYAFGGGCELALACDIRIAADHAVLSLPEVTLGILPGYGGVQRLVRTVGLAKAKELAFTANRIKAKEAYELGLVNQVVSQKDLIETCKVTAAKIAANAPAGIKAVKQIANISAGVEQTYNLEVQAFADCFKTEDQYQAMTAFLEKRTPEPFTGIEKNWESRGRE